MDTKLETHYNTTDDSSNVNTNLFIYQKVLENPKESYPYDFWKQNTRSKSQQLLEYYIRQQNIEPAQLPYRNIRKIIDNAKLTEPVQKAYLGNPYLLIEETFEEVSLEDLRWSIKPETDIREIQKLRYKYHATWKSISEYYNAESREIRKRAQIQSKEQDKGKKMLAPVLETLKFWLQIRRLRQNQTTIEQVISKMKEEDWSKDRTTKYLNQYNIKKEVGRQRSQLRKQKPINKEKLNPTEELVIQKLDGDTKRIKGYGADLLHNQKEVIEIKKALHNHSIDYAILQLAYAKQTLPQKIEDFKIYTKEYKLTQNQYSGYKKYINHYNITIHEYDQQKDKFIQKKPA